MAWSGVCPWGPSRIFLRPFLLLVLWFVALYGLGRPLSEFFRAPAEREPFIGTLTASQIVCLAAALTCLVALLVYQRRTLASTPLAAIDTA